MKRYLILGDGLLGSEIQRQTGWDYISRKSSGFDFETNFDKYCRKIDEYDVIVNCIAFTKTYSDDKDSHWNINYRRTCDLVDYCCSNKKKLIHISTDYVYTGSVENASEEDVPVHCGNWYGYTKLISDAYVQLRSWRYLLVRTSFKPNPFPYPKAIVCQEGNFDYVDVIAEKIIQLINKNKDGVFNVGTETKTIFELARQTNPNVLISFDELHRTMPRDITMNVDKMKKVIE